VKFKVLCGKLSVADTHAQTKLGYVFVLDFYDGVGNFKKKRDRNNGKPETIFMAYIKM